MFGAHKYQLCIWTQLAFLNWLERSHTGKHFMLTFSINYKNFMLMTLLFFRDFSRNVRRLKILSESSSESATKSD